MTNSMSTAILRFKREAFLWIKFIIAENPIFPSVTFDSGYSNKWTCDSVLLAENGCHFKSLLYTVLYDSLEPE